MPTSMPKGSDFPSHLTVSVIPPPPPSPMAPNVLLCLHGLGDTSASFASFARAINLPETCCVCLQAPTPLPFDLGGFHWGDDIVFDHSSGSDGAIELDTGFSRATRTIVHDAIEDVLVRKCGYAYREIMIFGFGQGGMAGMAAAKAMASSAAAGGDAKELGGLVTIGGPLPLSAVSEHRHKVRSPVLLCRGTVGSVVTDSAVQRTKAAFEFVEVVRWDKKGDGMPRNREEMLPIMQFFARRLRSRRGVPDGAVELT